MFFIGALTAALNHRWIRKSLPLRNEKWERSNYAKRTVSLKGGVSVAGALTAAPLIGLKANPSVAAASLIATGIAAGTGYYDDVYGNESKQAKGLKGHLGALKEGRVTTGLVKMAGIGIGSAAAAAFLTDSKKPKSYRLAQWATNTVLIAASANLHNLLDLRPGRSLKVAGMLASLTALTNRNTRLSGGIVTGAVLAGLPSDLGEETMLGDTGANALGALVGVTLAQTPLPVAAVAATAFTGLIGLSEKYSFTQFIESHPWLDNLDRLGSIR